MFQYLEPLTIGLIPTLIVIDWAIRGRKHDSTRFWRIRATAVTAAVFYIAGYVALLDPRKLGRTTTVFVEVTLQGQADEVLDSFEKAVALRENGRTWFNLGVVRVR